MPCIVKTDRRIGRTASIHFGASPGGSGCTIPAHVAVEIGSRSAAFGILLHQLNAGDLLLNQLIPDNAVHLVPIIAKSGIRQAHSKLSHFTYRAAFRDLCCGFWALRGQRHEPGRYPTEACSTCTKGVFVAFTNELLQPRIIRGLSQVEQPQQRPSVAVEVPVESSMLVAL